jgi:hypothetical protein
VGSKYHRRTGLYYTRCEGVLVGLGTWLAPILLALVGRIQKVGMGRSPFFAETHRLPTYTVRQPPEPNTTVRQQVREKLEKFRIRDYVSQGTVNSLTPYFAVPKGDGDVRVVFDGTRSQLNAALWAPPFVLPTINSLLRAVDVGTWMADIDIGEMFYNFSLDPVIQPHCGIDLKPYFNLGTWERWNRCVMGINHPRMVVK